VLRAGVIFALAAAAGVRADEPAPGKSVPGRIVERIVCRDQPAQSYALYLPTSYVTDRPAPILYLLDARGRALVALERFREAAEVYGWILASSYGSRSDTKDDPNTPALQAVWTDTHARLAIDPRRSYLGGLSGTARFAVAVAFEPHKAFAGILGCGAGFPGEKRTYANLPFLYFGTAGDRDFNYYEVRQLDADLAKAAAPYRIEYFDGGHDWAPPDLARRAVEWFELSAMKSGARPKDGELAAKLFAARLTCADELTASGRLAEAASAYAHAAEDARGLVDVAPAETKAASLGASADVRRALRDAADRDERDRAALRRLSQKIQAAARDPEIPAAAALSAELGIPALKHRAESGAPEERLSAERILANLRVETSFYLPEDLLARGDAAHARLLLSVAAEIDPDDPRIDYNLAGADARTGQTRRARRELERAVEKGFHRFDLLEQDPDFASLRTDPEFQKWLSVARARSAAAAPPTPAPKSTP
jgi:predicted esterase